MLEAAGRTGGHVFTYREGLDDGLYVDGGAEHFTKPGYDRYWSYVDEFDAGASRITRDANTSSGGSTARCTRRRCSPIPRCSTAFGFNRREVDYIVANGWRELAGLYYKPYIDAFTDEYKPFDAGLNHLDTITTTDLFRKDGASAGGA